MIEAHDNRIGATEARMEESHKEILETIHKVAFEEVEEKDEPPAYPAPAQHIKATPCVIPCEDKISKTKEYNVLNKDVACERILDMLKDRMSIEELEMLRELLILEGITYRPSSMEDLISECETVRQCGNNIDLNCEIDDNAMHQNLTSDSYESRVHLDEEQISA
uniref:Uncharacterized protein n=1 Tax=Chenopodium quinoa TaxID=63459 RepID=A0A803L3B6_CHEQI